MKYGHFNLEGFPIGFYDEEVHGPRFLPLYGEAPEPTEDDPDPEAPVIGQEYNPDTIIPQEAVNLTDLQWYEFISNGGFRRWIDGQVVPYAPPPPPAPPAQPSLFASAGFSINSGVVGTIEMAAQLTSAYYEEGWMFIAFAHPQDDANYLVFVQTDVPAKIEQFKDLGSFELVFSDPSTGDPIEPGRIDLQILKVR